MTRPVHHPAPAVVAYCIEGCGRPATTESTVGITSDGDEIAELLCSPCAASARTADPGLLTEERA